MRRYSLLLIVGLLAVTGCRSPGEPESTSSAAPGRPLAKRVAPKPLPATVRAVWVARFHYRTAEDVRRIMDNAAAIGCNTVLWQVRGEATVNYPSQIEPWGKEFGHRDPGFDPLQLAVIEAHRRGMRIEAWVNVMPGWRGRTPPPPTSPPHIYNAHPDWFLHDLSGNRQPLGDFYVIVNPCLPEVRRHITSVVEEIVTRYDVDGVHLDYVRFAWDGLKDAKKRFPRDGMTLTLYRKDSGKNPDDNVSAWNEWRANQITRLVGDIRASMRRMRPGATLTAAVWRNPQIAYNDFLQNGTAWLKAGWVDALMPMTYTDNLGQFERDLAAYRQIVGSRKIVPGLGLYTHNRIEATRQQMQRIRSWGGDVALYSYESLFDTGPGQASKKGSKDAALREQRRSAVMEGGTR